jgi:hypothetical protein
LSTPKEVILDGNTPLLTVISVELSKRITIYTYGQTQFTNIFIGASFDACCLER